MESAYYHLAHIGVKINTREELTKFTNIKPTSTHAVDSESKVVEVNKKTLATPLWSTFGNSSLNPTALFSIPGTKGKESSARKALKVFNLRITQKNYNGATWWKFIIDDPDQQQQGLDLQELGSLPCASCTFVGGSDDEPPPSAPDLFGVEIRLYWSLISLKSKPHSFLASWLSSEQKPCTPYSNICQILWLELPSQLPEDSYYKAVTKVTPFGWIASAVERASPYMFTPFILFDSD